jgi:hypothetical protein
MDIYKSYVVYKFDPTGEIKIVSSDTGDEFEGTLDDLFNTFDKYSHIATVRAYRVDRNDFKFIDDVIQAVNKIMTELDLCIAFEKDEAFGNCYEIKLKNQKYIDSYIINMSNEFFKLIEDIFKKFDLKFKYNNTRRYVFLECKS